MKWVSLRQSNRASRFVSVASVGASPDLIRTRGGGPSVRPLLAGVCTSGGYGRGRGRRRCSQFWSCAASKRPQRRISAGGRDHWVLYEGPSALHILGIWHYARSLVQRPLSALCGKRNYGRYPWALQISYHRLERYTEQTNIRRTLSRIYARKLPLFFSLASFVYYLREGISEDRNDQRAETEIIWYTLGKGGG